MMMRIIMAAIQ